MILLKDGYVLNMDSGAFEKKSILINGHTIQQVSKDIQVEDATIILCEGKWLIPGLIDMHVHIKAGFAHHFTAAGVTTVRNTAGSIIELNDMMIANSNEMTPRVLSADRMIDGPPGLWGADSPYNINVAEEEVARMEVRRQVELGADFIKIYGWLDEAIMKVVVDEAHLYGKEVSCDIFHSKHVNAIDVAKLGVKWFEHCSGVIQAMYPHWNMAASDEVFASIPWDAPDEQKIHAVCEQLLRYNINFCPTMVLYDQLNLVNNYWKPVHSIIDKIEERTSMIEMWNQILGNGDFLRKTGIQIKTIQKIAYTYHQMGGTVVPGTDTPAGIFTYPGLALHRELQLFTEAGFTPFETIYAATTKAAQALHLKDLGKIEAEYIADLLILNENPLMKIENTMKIQNVIKGGTLFTPQEVLNAVYTDEQLERIQQQLLEDFVEQGLVEASLLA